jgi:putative acetyltransferase
VPPSALPAQRKEDCVSTPETPGPPEPRAVAADTATGFSIRAREPSDSDGIAELMALPKVRFGTLRLPFTSRDATRKWMESMSDTHTAIVAVLNGRLIGSAALIQNKGRRSHVGGIGLCVHDDFQGRGIGSALVAALIEVADNWLNLRRLELSVYVDNEPAIRLYNKFGFVIEGTRRADAFRDGAFVDSHAMARLHGL